jgi:sporulation-control protein spo0M
MMKINAPKSVARGEVLKGIIEIGEAELKGAREVEIGFCSRITYGAGSRNYSSWEIKKTFSAEEARSLFELAFEFNVPRKAPITYSGKKVKSSWALKMKVDVAAGLDKEKEAEVIVLR